MPSFLTDVLEQLGWSDGTFLPVANEENKDLELLLEQRNKELIQLKSETDAQNLKQNELAQHRKNLLSEHQANMHLLVVHKEQMENEDHLSRIAANEAGKIRKDTDDMDKQCRDMERKAEGLRVDIARVLPKVESRRTGIGEERNSLEEWKSALKRGEADIQAIEAFSKEDKHKVEVLDGKRQRLKMDYDKKQEALFKFCCDLQSEERTAERVSHQVEEALAQRRETIATWAGAVECLRQRDKDIAQMKQELEMLRDYAKERGDQLMEKQDFLNAQLNNNKEAEKELAEAKDVLAHERMRLSKLQTTIKAMDNQYICMKRELAATATQLSNCRLDNKRMYKEKEDKEEAIHKLNEMIQNYKEKLAEVIDGTKTAEQRTRQLEDMLSNEEKYMRQLLSENDRLQHCIFRSQQLMESLKEEGNALKLETRGYRVAITQLGIKQTKLEKDLIVQKEVLYKVSYILEKVLLRLGRLEGTSVDYDEEERLEKRAGQLMLVVAERSSALQLLAAQLSRLVGEERTLARQLINNQGQHDIMKETMQKLTASGEGACRCLLQVRRSGRARRAEEGALRLRAGHAERALQRLGDQGLCLEKAGLGLRAAVCERAAEAKERLAVLQAQRRVLLDEKGNLNADLKAEQLQVEQLRKKYDICISTMGKDEDGQALSVTYFMVKNAQEKAELQQEGDALDAQIRKSEKEIAALEATLQVVDTANRNFIRNLAPPQDDDAEVMELATLTQEFHRAREQKSQLNLQCSRQSDLVDELRKDIASLAPQIEELENDKDSLLDEMSSLQKELFDQQDKLSRARAQCKRARIAAKKKIKDPHLWSMYETDIEWRALAEANKSAASQLLALQMPEIEERARQQGLNLSAIHSGPLTGIKLGSLSGRSSLLSETGSMAVRSVCDCTITSPFPSVGVSSTSSSGIRDKLEASRTVRSPLSDSQEVIPVTKKPSSMSQSKHGKQGTSHLSSASMPLSVVMLGLDTEPVKESPSSSQRSLAVKGSSSQRSVSSEQSRGKGDTRKTLQKKGTPGK